MKTRIEPTLESLAQAGECGRWSPPSSAYAKASVSIVGDGGEAEIIFPLTRWRSWAPIRKILAIHDAAPAITRGRGLTITAEYATP